MITTTSLTRAGAAAATVLCAVALAACGGDDDGASSGSSGTQTTAGDSTDAGRVQLTQCLRDQGIDVPDDAASGNAAPPRDLDVDAVREALEGPCERYADSVPSAGTDDEELQDRFQAFAQCMRDRGVDVPELPADGGPPAGGDQLLDQDDPQTAEALEACQDRLPQGAPGAEG